MEYLECPTCGPVNVLADVWEGAKAISGVCPNCAERLYFANPEREAMECCPGSVTVQVVSVQKDPNGGNVWYICEEVGQESKE